MSLISPRKVHITFAIRLRLNTNKLFLRKLECSRHAYGALSLTALIDLVTLTFHLLTPKSVHGLRAFILPILGFLGLSVLELGRGTRQTDGQTPPIIL